MLSYGGQRYQLGADGSSDVGNVELLPVFGSCCAIPVSLRIASATIAPLDLLLAERKTGPGRALLALLWPPPCSWSAYCSS